MTRLLFPISTPREINHVILTGTLSAAPQESRRPNGEPISLLRLEFPVADPRHPRLLWARASCFVEAPAEVATRYRLDEMRRGMPLLASGQLSDRWVVENGHASKRGVVVASLIRPGGPPGEPLLNGGGP